MIVQMRRKYNTPDSVYHHSPSRVRAHVIAAARYPATDSRIGASVEARVPADEPRRI